MKKIIALALAACMLLACVCTAVAEDKVYNIGILQLVQHNALDAATKGFRDALTELLGAEHVVFDEQNAQGDSAQCSTIATGFAANGYDLIMANATPALLACINATDTIPILGTSVTDYASAMDYETVEGGTGINVCGTSDGVIASMYVDCVLEIVPDAKKVAIVYCSAEPNSKVQADSFIAAMPEGIECVVGTFADTNDMQAVIAATIEGCDALYIPTDNTAASNMTAVANVCLAANMPVITGEENMMAQGGLATVSISYYGLGYTTGKMAYDILVNGADIATMEIQYAETLVKEYNPEFAEAIGVTIPEGYTAYSAQ